MIDEYSKNSSINKVENLINKTKKKVENRLRKETEKIDKLNKYNTKTEDIKDKAIVMKDMGTEVKSEAKAYLRKTQMLLYGVLGLAALIMIFVVIELLK